jgi:ATP-dependent exoDNAse (exonuclease V) alpha subunit
MSPYFFASHVIQELIQTNDLHLIELEKVYRQSDQTFITLLNAVRNRSITPADLAHLNTRVHTSPPKKPIVLTAVNAAADTLNQQRLKALRGTVATFSGTFSGDFPERETPTDSDLHLKKGARVMCVANDPNGQFVNGSLGVVKEIVAESEDEEASITVQLDEGHVVSISSHTWTIYRSTYNRDAQTLDQEKIGSFTQIPLKLAWAITIHKSQGKTFDEVTIDLGRGAFAAGQTYVALSRCRSFEGLTLVQPVKLQDIRLDYSIVKFITSLQYQLSTPS